MTPQRFNASVTRSGTRAIIAIPFDPDAIWGSRQRHYIAGSVNGCGVRGVLEPSGDKFVLSLGPAWRRDNGIDVGAEVTVELYPEGPQSEALAPDVSKALAAAPDAKDFFDSLASFYRKNFIRWIESAKRPQTRATRIDEMIKALEDRHRQI